MALLNETQQNYYDGNDFGGYQFVSLEYIITNFTVAYVGEGKIISKVKRTDIAFHAQRAIQELSFDTFKSIKSQEITLPPSNTMVLPQDYVNYTKICCVDGNGIERPLYPTRHTSNPTPILQNSDGEYTLTATGTLVDSTAAISLDGEYSTISVGMTVSGHGINHTGEPNIPDGTIVIGSHNANGITTIEVGEVDPGSLSGYKGVNILLLTSPVTQRLTFGHADGELTQFSTGLVLENVSWFPNDTKITQAPNTGVSNVKVGMIVSHQYFPIGTTVVDVQGAVVTTSAASTGGSKVGTTNPWLGEMTFISYTGDSSTWNSYKATTPSENNNNHYANHSHDDHDHIGSERYGLEPSHAQTNGSFYIDDRLGKIHFSSNISGKTVILDYISDSLGTDGEMQVPKLAEDAMYKHILCDMMGARANIGGGRLAYYKKDKFAAVRKAKLRLSNIKLEELTQILRGQSKHIKH